MVAAGRGELKGAEGLTDEAVCLACWPATAERLYFFFQAEDGIRDLTVTGVQTCALPISQPAVIIYGGTPSSPNINDAAIFAATNDGYLHAFDVTNGQELWAFIPQELLGDLYPMYTNSPTSPKHYELDGSIRILKYDINGDGIVDPVAGDRVIAYFGNGRGGGK